MEEAVGLAIYYLVLFLLFALVIAKKVGVINNGLLLVLFAAVLIFLATFKAYGVDKDYENYISSFNDVGPPIDYFKNYDQWFFFEGLFYLIPSVVKLFVHDHFEIVCFFIFSTIGTVLVFKAIKRYSVLVAISLLYYYCFYFFLQGLTQIRAAIACGCLLWCIHFYYERKYRFFFLFAALGFLFQYTSILILFIFLFDRTSFSLKKYTLLLVAVLIISLLRSNILIQPLFMLNVAFVKKLALVLRSMSEDENAINIFNVGFVLNLISTFWLMINHKKLLQITPNAHLYIKIQILSIICYCIFTSIAVISFRTYEFFGIVNILTIPLLVFTFRYKAMGYVAATSYALMLFLINIHFTKLVGPYKFVFLS